MIKFILCCNFNICFSKKIGNLEICEIFEIYEPLDHHFGQTHNLFSIQEINSLAVRLSIPILKQKWDQTLINHVEYIIINWQNSFFKV